MAGRSGDMAPGRMAGEDENLTIWSDTETALFLKIWRRPDVQTALRQYTRKRPIWKKVSAELAIEGYRRSAEQCKSKMHNLMTSYRRVKKGVDPESRCKFFSVIDQVMTSPEFEAATAGAAGLGGDAADLDGDTSEESGPSTSGLSDYPHSQSVSPGGRDDSAGDGDRSWGGHHPWWPVPVRASDAAGFAPARDRPTPQQRDDDRDSDHPPRKRYCNWEERYSRESGSSLAIGPPAPAEPADRSQRAVDWPPLAPRDAHPDDSHIPRDLRVISSSAPDAVTSPPRAPPPPPPPPPPRSAATLEDSSAFSEARDLIAERARQLLRALPRHPELRSEDHIGNGHPRHAEENGLAPPVADDRTVNSLERMENLLQELVDMQRAFLLSEERRRREQLVREENWRIQDREFLVRLVQTLASTQH